MSKHSFKTLAKCSECKGTGLYVGVAERDGYAVVCFRCKGTGERELELHWEDPEGRIPRDDVTWVLEGNPGIMVGDCEMDFGGMSYQDFVAGKPFPPKSEMREHTCPKQWAQNVSRSKFDMDECYESLGRRFDQCPSFSTKHICWARFDRWNRDGK